MKLKQEAMYVLPCDKALVCRKVIALIKLFDWITVNGNQNFPATVEMNVVRNELSKFGRVVYGACNDRFGVGFSLLIY